MFIRSLLRLHTFAPDDGTGSPAPAAPATSEPATFSVDYVRELRAENKGYRLKAHQFEAAAAEAKSAAEKATAELAAVSTKAAKDIEARVAEVSAAASQRLVRAEIKAGAAAAGLAHADFLKLVDTSSVTVDKDGEVQVPDGFWADVKSKLPHLFTATGADKGTTTNPASPPKAVPAGNKHVSQMTKEEADAAEAALLAKR